jgi:release factor glutamine methyltransferase
VEIRNLRIESCNNVYGPREDSYLLADAVEKYAFGKALDLGTGGGLQGIVAAMNKCDVTFSDIDPNAVECAKVNAKLNRVTGKFMVSDMFDGINGRFNTIIFNPPYLISEENKHIALDGGKNGRHYIDRFISSYKDHLLENHVVLLVESSLNNYEKDVERLKAKVVSKAHYFFEDIVVLMF